MGARDQGAVEIQLYLDSGYRRVADVARRSLRHTAGFDDQTAGSRQAGRGIEVGVVEQQASAVFTVMSPFVE
jgi:hypothetical protein